METKNKQMDKTKLKQTRRYRGQTSSFQWGEGSVQGPDRNKDKVQTTMYKINKIQGYVA